MERALSFVIVIIILLGAMGISIAYMIYLTNKKTCAGTIYLNEEGEMYIHLTPSDREKIADSSFVTMAVLRKNYNPIDE